AGEVDDLAGELPLAYEVGAATVPQTHAQPSSSGDSRMPPAGGEALPPVPGGPGAWAAASLSSAHTEAGSAGPQGRMAVSPSLPAISTRGRYPRASQAASTWAIITAIPSRCSRAVSPPGRPLRRLDMIPSLRLVSGGW